eukprot:TRINITY_DN41221_c0_g1_i2.p1 TRINITY_DN41221_c0_g1~~TRINITY_DN41221_c0_g1_i2.p1  ORF type:complete len:130 (-),score=5.99 TRINITY_DN41221_c0_g1_i2:41-430(-)
MSTGGPRYSCLRWISGGENSGVPHKVLSHSSECRSLVPSQIRHSPKSVILDCSPGPRSTFASLRSLWTIRWLWRYLTATASWAQMTLAFASVHRPWFLMKFSKSPCCLLYPSDAADEEDSVELGGGRVS